MHESVLVTMPFVAVLGSTNEDAAQSENLLWPPAPASLTVICISNCINSHRPSAGLHDSRLDLMLAWISGHGLVYSQRRQKQGDTQKGRRRLNCSKLIAISSQILLEMLHLICIYGVRIAAAAKIAFAVLPTNSPARVRLPAATASVTPGYVTGA